MPESLPLRAFRFEISSRLAAPAEEVWSAVTRPEVLNDELGPWFRVPIPATVRALRLETAPVGVPLARAWVLFLGFVPIDYDDLTLVSVGPGMRFHERSPMLNCRIWEHRRSVDPQEQGCLVTDRISFQPRWFMSGRLYVAIVYRIFRHRHHRLRQRFGPA
jgi:ligand-binding SRPBCC domain-containing protein